MQHKHGGVGGGGHQFSCRKQILVYLFQLSNHLFEELAMDVYDEVDRRENDSG